MYEPLLKNSTAYMEIPDWRIFLMKDMAAVEGLRGWVRRCIRGLRELGV
jgi:hypothetical protein